MIPYNPKLKFSSATLKNFRVELLALQKEIESKLGDVDLKHLYKIELRGRIAAFLGYALIWFPNPISPLLLAFAQLTRWNLAHFILHRGYDKVPLVPPRYTSKEFAKGLRRFIDWFDWIHPQAWNQEHNVLHHYRPGEECDPSVVDHHELVQILQRIRLPRWLKIAFVFLIASSWRFTHYVPTSMSTVNLSGSGSQKGLRPPFSYVTILDFYKFWRSSVRQVWIHCLLPFGLFHFVIIPLIFLPWGIKLSLIVLGHKILAELLVNIYSFVIIAPNHAGDDLYLFNYQSKNAEVALFHQVLNSTNYKTGGDWNDHWHIWLNYQIEHHLIPNLPMYRYQEIQPQIKSLCEKYQLPYTQENVVVRFRKLVDILIGKSKMMTLNTFPMEEEIGKTGS